MKESVIVKMVHGSHLYGLDTENSDVDYKGIILPTKRDLLLQRGNFQRSESTSSDKQKNTSSDVDVEFYSLHKFLDMACSGETIAIDMLHCTNPVTSSPIWESIRANRSLFYTSDMKAFVGYAKRQAHRYGIRGSKLKAIEEIIAYLKTKPADHRLTESPHYEAGIDGLSIAHPSYIKVMRGFEKNGKYIDKHVVDVCGSKFDFTCTIGYIVSQLEKIYKTYGHRAQQAKLNDGIDWKAVSHAIRAAYQLLEIYETGDLIYPLKERDFILNVKLGKLDFTSEVAPVLEDLVDRVEVAAAESQLPKKVDREKIDNWLVSIYEGEFS